MPKRTVVIKKPCAGTASTSSATGTTSLLRAALLISARGGLRRVHRVGGGWVRLHLRQSFGNY